MQNDFIYLFLMILQNLIYGPEKIQVLNSMKKFLIERNVILNLFKREFYFQNIWKSFCY